MALVGVELETLISEPDALTTRYKWSYLNSLFDYVCYFQIVDMNLHYSKLHYCISNKCIFGSTKFNT